MSPGRRRPARTSTVAPPNALVWPRALPAPGLAVTVAAGFLIVEAVLVVLLKQVEPKDPVGIVYAGLMGVALGGNFVAGVAAAASAAADRRREAELSSELAHTMLRAGDLQSAADGAGRRLAAAFNLRFASVVLTGAAGDHRPGAIPLHEDDVLFGVLEVPDDLPRTTLERLLRVVPTLEALLAAARDREKVNNTLIESRHRLERFFDLTSDLMVISDQGKLLEVNPAFEKTLGYTVDDLAAAPFELVPPEDMDRLREPIKDLTEGRGPVRFENRATSRDGSSRWIEWTVAPHQRLFYAVGRDVTAQREEEEQLRETRTMLEASRERLRASRDRLRQLARHQTALRRVAELVARDAEPAEVFNAVAEEMANILDVYNATVARYEGDEVVIAALARPAIDLPTPPVVGERFPLDGDHAAVIVRRTGRPARIDSHEHAAGASAARIREMGVKSMVAVPIMVGEQLWGVATVASRGDPLPADTEVGIADFADLVATAIANAAAREQLNTSRDTLRQLARQQTALRRVAELVARGAESAEVFAAVAEDMAGCLDAFNATVGRFEGDEIVIEAIGRPELDLPSRPAVGERFPLDGDHIAPTILRTGRPARMDNYEHGRGATSAYIRGLGIQSMVGVPIVVGTHIWGVVAVASGTGPLPADTEARMADFADLVGTSIANAATRSDLEASRDSLRELADSLSVLARQQTALRRVATLVARGVSQSEVFSAVAEEMAECLNTGNAEVFRYENDGEAVIVVASCSPPGVPELAVGESLPTEGENIAATVFRTRQPARIDSWGSGVGPIAERARELGRQSRVGAPIVVDERVWGMALVGTTEPDPLPPDTEGRIAEFAELVATAIAAATARADLIASRARIVAAADDARRRLERDIHDGAQQRLVALGLKLRLAESGVPDRQEDLRNELSEVVSGLTDLARELQEISRGLHPAILSRGGLPAAFKTLARRSAVPVNLDAAIERRLPDSVEVAAYYVVAEALTNAAKHAQASEVEVRARVTDEALELSICDDGIGGADSRKGSGLIGLRDRIEVLGGRMQVASPLGCGTALEITIPHGANAK